MKAYLINMHLLVPRSRSSAKVKVKYKGYTSQKMAVLGCIHVSETHLVKNGSCEDIHVSQTHLVDTADWWSLNAVSFRFILGNLSPADTSNMESVKFLSFDNPFPHNPMFY